MYPMLDNLNEKTDNSITPYIIVNFSPTEYLHLPKHHAVAFAENDCKEKEVLEIGAVEGKKDDQLRNWIPKRK